MAIMSPSAYGRYIDCMNVHSKKVIVEIRVLEKNVVINDQDVRTNKWLLPQYWQEVYDILHSAAANHMKNKFVNGITKHGENLSVSLDFVPYVPAYMYILKPDTCISNMLDESFIDSGSASLEEPPYEWMVVAVVSPRCTSGYYLRSRARRGHDPVATELSNSANECSLLFRGFSDSECKKAELHSRRIQRSQH